MGTKKIRSRWLQQQESEILEWHKVQEARWFAAKRSCAAHSVDQTHSIVIADARKASSWSLKRFG